MNSQPRAVAGTDAANEEVKALKGEIEEFFRIASHDLRAPLRHISAFGGLLRERIDELGGDAEARELLSIIQRSGEQLTRMVDGLLQLSSVGRAPFAREPVDIAALAHEVRAQLATQQASRSVDWQLPDPSQADCVGEGDPVLLRQLLTHLMGNALKFSRNRPSARICLQGRRGADGALRIELEDNGAGFRMEAAGRLFGVFERLHSTSEFEGTGIGLATARRIVERHGGQIGAEGVPDAGCTIWFTLPPVGRPSGMPTSLL